MEEKRSARNSMLEAMSDVQSVQDHFDQHNTSLIQPQNQMVQNHNGSDKEADSGSEMMQFNEDAQMD